MTDLGPHRLLKRFASVALTETAARRWLEELARAETLAEVSPWLLWDESMRRSSHCVFWRKPVGELLRLLGDHRMPTRAVAVGLFHGADFGVQKAELEEVVSSSSRFLEGVIEVADNTFLVVNHSGMMCVCTADSGLCRDLQVDAR